MNCTECQLAYFTQDKDLLSPHVIQTRNLASYHTTLRCCLWMFVPKTESRPCKRSSCRI